ncbi:PaeR7I family type II restriction endonuclease [Paracoccus chinensis]|nr:PaeR7I family type II restriction endonuclease [Paracoccus chinensis]
MAPPYLVQAPGDNKKVSFFGNNASNRAEKATGGAHDF